MAPASEPRSASNPELDVNSRRLLEDAGLLLLASGAIAAILFVVGASIAAVRYGILPRWLGWAGFAVAALLPLAVAFVGFVTLFLWVLAVSVVMVARSGRDVVDARPA